MEVFPIFGWNLYPHTHPYRILYIARVVKEHKKSVSLHKYTRHNKYQTNRILNQLGYRLNKWELKKDSKVFQKTKKKLEKYILKHVKKPLSYQLLRQKVHLPHYVLSKKKSIISEKIILEGEL